MWFLWKKMKFTRSSIHDIQSIEEKKMKYEKWSLYKQLSKRKVAYAFRDRIFKRYRRVIRLYKRVSF